MSDKKTVQDVKDSLKGEILLTSKSWALEGFTKSIHFIPSTSAYRVKWENNNSETSVSYLDVSIAVEKYNSLN